MITFVGRVVVSDKYAIGTWVQHWDRVGRVIDFADYDCGESERQLILNPSRGPWVIIHTTRDDYTSGYLESSVLPLQPGDTVYTAADGRGACAECEGKARWDDYLCKVCRALCL